VGQAGCAGPALATVGQRIHAWPNLRAPLSTKANMNPKPDPPKHQPEAEFVSEVQKSSGPAPDTVTTRPPAQHHGDMPASKQEDVWKQPPPRRPVVQSHRGGLILFMGLTGVFLSLAAPCLTFIFWRILDGLGGASMSSDLRNQLIMAEALLGLGAGVLAWYWGHLDGQMMAAGKMDTHDRGMTRTGRVMGQIAVLLLAAILLFCAGGVFFRWLSFLRNLKN
jgi:hypothetical protein